MNTKLFRSVSVLLVSFWMFTSAAVAQIAEKGTPVFLQTKQKKALEVVEMPPFVPIYKNIIQKKQHIGLQTKAMQYAYEYKVSYNMNNSGVWQKLPDGRRVWRLAIRSKGAYSLGLWLSKYHLPKGAKLFIYNTGNNYYLGAFTAKNNKPWGTLAIQAFAGDKLILEYIEPENPDFKGELEVGGVLHDYKNIFKYINGTSLNSLGDSGSCNVDVNCDAGDDWQIEKRAVCKIISNGYYGSGALLNNSNFDAIPYFLTAYHVISTPEKAHNAVFYFNFENTACKSHDAKDNQTISGAELRAISALKETKDGWKPHLDFALLEMSSQPPVAYNAYYAGWDYSGRVPAFTVSIHHPEGDAKKISIDNDAPKTSTYEDNEYKFDKDSHWQILEWDLGTTEGGSSGAPLFDENHRIIGDLTGGDASCSAPVNDFYAKLSVSWDKFPDKENQLKYWLNPKNITSKTLNGFDPNVDLYADFSLSKEMVCVDVAVEITNLSVGEPQNYVWDFGEGAEPRRTATGAYPPKVRYKTPGIKTITLTVEKNGKTNRVSKQLNVVALPKANFSYVLQGGTKVNFIQKCNDAQYYLWHLGDGTTSTDAVVEHIYNEMEAYNVTLRAGNDCGDNTVSKIVALSYDKAVLIYPNPSDAEFNIDLHRVKNERVLWELYSESGMKIQNGVANKANNIKLNLYRLQTGVYLLKLNIDGKVLERKLLKID